MADPRFFKNTGPYTLAQVCEKAGMAVPPGADGDRMICDLADLAAASARDLTFFTGARPQAQAFADCQAGVCLVAMSPVRKHAAMTLLPVASVTAAFAGVAAMFYPDYSLALWEREPAISPDARIGENVAIAPHVTIAAGAEIGDNTRIGPGAAIGPGVAIGRDCEIGANVSISHAYLGDRVVVFPNAAIGQPGFGFTLAGAGFVKIPQLGRVIIQDGCEIGSCTTIDRGALGDTVIGEGSKIDNLVQIAHNCRIGRNCVIAGQTGLAGSVVLEDGVILAGQVGLGDHSRVGAGARMGARSGTASRITLEGGVDYGGVPAKPVKEWAREVYALTRLAKRKQDET